MIIDTRNKKNANYAKNLHKRNGITKANHTYINNIKVSTKNDLDANLVELTLTKRHGRIVSREIPVFNWTKQAKETLELLQNQKIKSFTKEPVINIITDEQAIENWNKRQENKKKNLEELPFSKEHYKLVNELYSSETKDNKYLKQAAENEAHNRTILNLKTKLEQQRLLKKHQNKEQMPYKIVIQHSDDTLNKTFYSRNSEKELSEIMSKLNKNLSKESDSYKSISLFGKNSATPQMIYTKAA